MKRIAPSLVAAASLALGLASADCALAREHGRGREAARERNADQGPPGRGVGLRDAVRGRDGGGDDRRYGDRYEDGPGRGRAAEALRERLRRFQDNPPPPDAQRDDERSFAPRPGRFMPPDARGEPVYDYQRYRLRPPPRGYQWMRFGSGIALVGPDGQVFDVVPY